MLSRDERIPVKEGKLTMRWPPSLQPSFWRTLGVGGLSNSDHSAWPTLWKAVGAKEGLIRLNLSL